MGRWIDGELQDPTVLRGMATIADVVRRGRRSAGLTQERLAAAAELNQSTISRLERGQLRAMRLVRLARVIGAIVEFRGLPPPARLPGRKTHAR
jgi:transcriptional regulator with XRE-family HTH domain